MQWVQRQYAISQILRKQCVNKLFQLGDLESFTENCNLRNRLIFSKN